MKIHDVEQGSADWFDLRKGIPTASEFHQIICPQGGKPLKKGGHRKMLSATAPKYGYKLIAERLLNRSLDSLAATEWMRRGKEMEPTAARMYQGIYEVETAVVGFVTDHGETVGCSPDRMVKGSAIAIEIKSPSPAVHLQYLLAAEDPAGPLHWMPPEYRPQVQGSLLVADDIDRWDFFSFHPEMPPARIIVTRDEPYLKLLGQALHEFQLLLIAMEERARSLGAFQAFAEAVTPLEVERAGELADTFKRDFGLTEDFVR